MVLLRSKYLIILTLVIALLPVVAAVETGGYIVQPAYGIYPEYNEIYFEPRSADTILLNDPVPTPISLTDLPPWVLVVLGIAAISPGIIYGSKYLCAANVPLIGGFKRISKKNILENSSREAVYQCVKEHPGIRPVEMQRSTGFTYKNILYHLNLLKTFGKVIPVEYKNTVGFFENSGRFSTDERLMIMHLTNERERKILQTIAEHPGISRNDISTRVGISGPSVSWHIHFMVRNRIIEQRRKGNMVKHYVRDTMIEIYQRYTSGGSG